VSNRAVATAIGVSVIIIIHVSVRCHQVAGGVGCTRVQDILGCWPVALCRPQQLLQVSLIVWLLREMPSDATVIGQTVCDMQSMVMCESKLERLSP
jgi:hypothetical protein